MIDITHPDVKDTLVFNPLPVQKCPDYICVTKPCIQLYIGTPFESKFTISYILFDHGGIIPLGTTLEFFTEYIALFTYVFSNYHGINHKLCGH